MYKALAARMSPEARMMEVRWMMEAGWPEMRCCTQDDDRGQVEVMEVMMMKSMVTDMHEMDPPHTPKTKQAEGKSQDPRLSPETPL